MANAAFAVSIEVVCQLLSSAHVPAEAVDDIPFWLIVVMLVGAIAGAFLVERLVKAIRRRRD